MNIEEMNIVVMAFTALLAMAYTIAEITLLSYESSAETH